MAENLGYWAWDSSDLINTFPLLHTSTSPPPLWWVFALLWHWHQLLCGTMMQYWCGETMTTRYQAYLLSSEFIVADISGHGNELLSQCSRRSSNDFQPLYYTQSYWWSNQVIVRINLLIMNLLSSYRIGDSMHKTYKHDKYCLLSFGSMCKF